MHHYYNSGPSKGSNILDLRLVDQILCNYLNSYVFHGCRSALPGFGPRRRPHELKGVDDVSSLLLLSLFFLPCSLPLPPFLPSFFPPPPPILLAAIRVSATTLCKHEVLLSGQISFTHLWLPHFLDLLKIKNTTANSDLWQGVCMCVCPLVCEIFISLTKWHKNSLKTVLNL